MIEWLTSTYVPAKEEFWILIALLIFIAILMWKGVPKAVGGKLDDRSAAIAKELADARNLREEAQELLASYQRRQREAEGEAEILIAQARAEADRLREDAVRTLQEQLEARTRMAEDRIARAEKQAESDVRAAAADLAANAAERLIRARLDDSGRARIFDASLKDMERRLQ